MHRADSRRAGCYRAGCAATGDLRAQRKKVSEALVCGVPRRTVSAPQSANFQRPPTPAITQPPASSTRSSPPETPGHEDYLQWHNMAGFPQFGGQLNTRGTCTNNDNVQACR